jgi:hypothetical protein
VKKLRGGIQETVQSANCANEEFRGAAQKLSEKETSELGEIMRGNVSGKRFELTIMRKSVGETMEKSETAMDGMEMEQFCC